MTAFYNEIDPYAAQWLRNLIAAGKIAPGIVDERSIEDIFPDELHRYTQCHFFAGIGVWSHALRLAGWSDGRPVWTGSCPCQPFSTAGKGAGFADERHLWPAFHWLIEQCRPPVVFGEQVASNDGLAWLDLIQADLEGSGYSTGAADLCAAGIGAPHIRQRLYWVADSDDNGCCERGERRSTLGHWKASKSDCSLSGLADSESVWQHRETLRASRELHANGIKQDGGSCRSGPTHSFWGYADWLFCRDGKWRPVEPGTFPMAHGPHADVGRLRAYGNAIVPQVAQVFIKAYQLRELSVPDAHGNRAAHR